MELLVLLVISCSWTLDTASAQTCESSEYFLHSTRDRNGACGCALSNEERQYYPDVGSPGLPVDPLPTGLTPSRQELRDRLVNLQQDLVMLDEGLYWLKDGLSLGYRGTTPSQQDLAGPPGPAGVPGEEGATGGTGATGATGEGSATGPRGAPGPPGETGATGRGPEGERGRQGTEGVRGREGYPGQDGAPGRDGVQGWPGPRGRRGRTGATGRRGPDRVRLGPDDSGLVGSGPRGAQ